MAATKTIKTRVQFGVRPISEDDGTPTGRFYCEIIAITPRDNCYRLGHAASDADDDDPAVNKIDDITLEYAVRLWRADRRSWLPDTRGGAGVKLWLNDVDRSEGAA